MDIQIDFEYIFGVQNLISVLALSLMQCMQYLAKQDGVMVRPYCIMPDYTLGQRENGHHFAEDIFKLIFFYENHSLLWLHNGRDSVSNHQPHSSLLNCLLGRRSKKT